MMWIIINFLVISLISNGLSQPPPGGTNYSPETPVDYMTPPPIPDASTMRHLRVHDEAEPTFFQRISRWMFPWGSGAEKREANQKLDDFYGAPPQFKDSVQTTLPPTTTAKCTPCNNIPWVPMYPFYAQSPAFTPPKNNNPRPQAPPIKFQQSPNDFYQQPPPQKQTDAGFGYGGSYDNKRPINNIEFTTVVPYVSRPSNNFEFTTTRPQTNYQRPNKQVEYPTSNSNAGSYDIRQLIRNNELKIANQQKGNSDGYDYRRPTAEFSTPQPFNGNNGNQGNHGNNGNQGNQGNHEHHGDPSNRKPIKLVSFTTSAPFAPTQEAYKYNPIFDVGVTSPEYLPPPSLLPITNEYRPFAAIPVPNLSMSPIPPLYNYKIFHQDTYGQPKRPIINKDVEVFPSVTLRSPSSFKPLPANTLSYNLPPGYGGYSDNMLNIAGSIMPEKDKSIEVVRSIPVAEFTSIVEYPPTVVKTHVIDIKEGPIRTHYGELTTETPVENHTMKPIVVETIDTHFAASEKKENITLNVSAPNERESSTRTAITVVESVQTAVDKDKKKSGKLDRETPKILLDLPIYHSKSRPFSRYNDEESVATISTTVVPRTTPKKVTKSRSKSRSTVPSRFKPKSLPSSTAASIAYNSGSTAVSIDLTDVTPGPTQKYASSTKKPKQIQIIIPYTSYHKPMPFKAREELEPIRKGATGHYVTYDMKSGWSNTDIHDKEYRDAHDTQESKLVTSTITSSPAPLPQSKKYLTKVLASSIRELLEKEKTIKGMNATRKEPIDLMKLQRKIDVWTEQEFSLSDFDLVANKASTITLFGRTKIIPPEYLTTTPAVTNKYATTTEAPTTTDVSHQKGGRLFNHKLIEENHLYDDSNRGQMVQHEDVFHFSRISTQKSTKDMWNKLRLAYSPLTREKVYVVTPIPFAYTPPYYEENGEVKSASFEVRSKPAMPNAETSAISRLVNNLDANARNPHIRRSVSPHLAGRRL